TIPFPSGKYSTNDIRSFFEHHFGEISKHNPGLESQWPGSDVIEGLVEKAAGLFIWARTVIRLISRGEPRGQLRRIMQGRNTGNISNLYSLILDISFANPTKEEINAFQAIMGSIILAKSPLSVSTLHHLLLIEESIIFYIINGLYSVLEPKKTLRIAHQSFADFLIDEKECPPTFYIQIEQQKENLTVACLKTMQKELRFNICQIQSSYLRNSDIPGISKIIERNISSHLCYSCWYWTDHLISRGHDSNICEELRWFMNNQFLFWLEVMSLTAISILYKDSYPQTLKIASGGQNDWPAIRYSLTGLKSPASSLAFSPDCKRIASGHEDGTIRIWGAEMGDLIAGPFEGHISEIASIKISPDNKLVLSRSLNDGIIRVWNIDTGECTHNRFFGYSESLMSPALSPDGKRVVSATGDEGFLVWSVETGEVVSGPFSKDKDMCLSASFSPDGGRVALSCGDTVQVYEVETGVLVAGPFKGHTGPIILVEYLPDGK
ncbi:9303_t:CDS:2, partial [Acaulospora colombiana]